jgi:cystathionine beta-lyase
MQPTENQIGIGTRLAKLGRMSDEHFGFINTPTYRGSTVLFKTLDDFEHGRARYTYGTAGTPTVESLESAWTSLTGAAGTVLCPSGLGAVALALLSTLKQGDHLLIPDSVYLPTRALCCGFLARFGIETTFYDPLLGRDLERLVKANTSTIFLESPGSQTFEIQDVPQITALAGRRGIKTIIDNTWATPLFFSPHEHGCDLAVEAGTKYLSGHSDLLLGLVSARAEAWPDLQKTHQSMAIVPGPEDCSLALRGMRTLHIRLKEAQTRGLEMAHWLQTQPEIATVLHPAFPSCPGHALWKRDFKGSTGVFSVILRSGFSRESLAEMLDHLAIFGMGDSWGGFESLIVPFDVRGHRTVTRWNPGGFSLRLQIGLEELDDLQADLRAGLDRLSARGPSPAGG